MKPLFIVNPASGGGRTKRTFPELRATAERVLGPVDAEYTKHPGHAVALAEAAARDGRELIVAVGGDGTLSDCVDGVMRSEAGGHVELGLIGQGTGGDFRKTLGIEHRLDRYLEALTSGRKRTIDVGRAQLTGHDGAPRTRHFVNILSAGLGGLVDQYVATGSRLLGGTAAYYVASVRALLRSKITKVRCTVTSDGVTTVREVEALMIAVCNGEYFGSGMHVAPMAKPDDGRFDVIRPLIDCAENDIRELSQERGYPILPCNLCGSQDGLKRDAMHNLLTTLEATIPDVRAVMHNAIRNVRPSHLLDKEVCDAWMARPDHIRPKEVVDAGPRKMTGSVVASSARKLGLVKAGGALPIIGEDA